MSKEKSIKIGNILLIASMIVLIASLLLFLLPFESGNVGLELAFGKAFNPLVCSAFVLAFASLLFSLLIYAIKRFPWGKMVLIALGVFSLVSGVLLLIANLNYVSIISSVLIIITFPTLFLSALFK